MAGNQSDSPSSAVDRLDMLLQHRQNQGLAETAESVESVAEIPSVLTDTPIIEARDFIEALFLSLPMQLRAAVLLVTLVFISWYFTFLFFREAQQRWTEDGFFAPALKLVVTATFCFIAWSLLWVLVPGGLTTIRHWACGLAALLGVLTGIKYLSDLIRAYCRELVEGVRLRRLRQKSEPKESSDAAD